MLAESFRLAVDFVFLHRLLETIRNRVAGLKWTAAAKRVGLEKMQPRGMA